MEIIKNLVCIIQTNNNYDKSFYQIPTCTNFRAIDFHIFIIAFMDLVECGPDIWILATAYYRPWFTDNSDNQNILHNHNHFVWTGLLSGQSMEDQCFDFIPSYTWLDISLLVLVKLCVPCVSHRFSKTWNGSLFMNSMNLCL